MGSESTSRNDPEPVDDLPRSGSPQPARAPEQTYCDATIEFRPGEVGNAEGPLSGRTLSLAEYPFLEPPRGGDELGWLAHYRVLRPLGSGGMGLVFLAEDTHLLRPVALKVIRPELAGNPEAAPRFLREARTAAAIKHDNVVTIYHVGEARGVSYLAMEYLQGISLAAWLDRGRQPSIELRLRMGREVASGLAAAHRLGLVHRDIKPANIWLEAPSGRAKILDFGQARAESEDTQITRSGAIMGTPAFMSPEQAEGNPVTFATDLFSLGGVLYRLCCGRLPFEGKTILSVLNALATQTPTPPLAFRPETPERFSALVMRLLAKSPQARPPSAQAIVDEIRAIERQLAASRQRTSITTDTETGSKPVETMQVKPVDAASLRALVHARLADRRPSRWLMLSAVVLIVGVLTSAAWLSHGGPGLHRGPERGSPLAGRGFRRPPAPEDFVKDPPPDEPPPPPRPPGEFGPRWSGAPRRALDPEPPDAKAHDLDQDMKRLEAAGVVLRPPDAKQEAQRSEAAAAKIPASDPGAMAAPNAPGLALAPAGPAGPGASGPTAASGPPATSGPRAASGGSARPATAGPAAETRAASWGKFIDLDGDCSFTLDEADQTATMQVPGRPHALSAELGRLNAPRILQPVSGDFEAFVRVLGTEQVAGRATMTEYPPYHGAGILLWQDAGNYVRLEIATDLQRGKPRHYVNFEYRQGYRLASSQGQVAPTGSAYLRFAQEERGRGLVQPRRRPVDILSRIDRES